MAAADLPSYRDLPKNVYQVEWKYRDEFRPRFGMLRVREFLMKDAYSIDRDKDGMRASYRVMYEAYERIFDRLGLDTAIVERGGSGGVSTTSSWHARASASTVRRMRERRLPRRHRGCPATGAGARPGRNGDAHRGRYPEHADDRVPGGAAERGAVPDVEVRDVRRGRDDDGGPGPRRIERGQHDKLGKIVFPAKVRPVRRRCFRARGFGRGTGRTAGLRRRCAGVRGRMVPRGGNDWVTGSNTKDRHVTGANVGRDFRVRIAGRTWWSSARAIAARSTAASCASRVDVLGTSTSWGRSTRRRSTRRSWTRTTHKAVREAATASGSAHGRRRPSRATTTTGTGPR